jgi:hypothetical protein
MTDLDTLRRSLRVQTPAGYGQGSVDVAEIMTKGRRLRVRRRLAAAGGVLCVAATVFGAVTGVSHLVRTSPVPAQHPASSVSTAHPPSPAITAARTPAPSPRPVRSAAASPERPSASPSGSPQPLSRPSAASPAGPTPIPASGPARHRGLAEY